MYSEISFPEDREYMIERIAAQEWDVPYAALVGIAAVIINRTEDSRFPDTAAEVINSMPELRGAAYLRGNNEVSSILAESACTSAMNGADPTGGALYFKISSPPKKGDINEYPPDITAIGNVLFSKRDLQGGVSAKP